MTPGLLIAGKYRLLRPIGAGGMGQVWVAEHALTERPFAMKFLHAEVARDRRMLARFVQEARVSAKIRHPNVVEVFDVGTADEAGGAPFLVMELLEGIGLDAALAAHGTLPWPIAVEVSAVVARAVSAAHAAGVIHRDLKPANVFLQRTHEGGLAPKVLDFGISKVADSGRLDRKAGLTQTGAILGSPIYMSPEQAASDKTIDGRSDVHAIGVMLWECLTGRPPFAAETYNNLVVEIMTGDRPRLAEALPSAPKALGDVVAKAMARRRDDRFATASELGDALNAVLAQHGPFEGIASPTVAQRLLVPASAPSASPPTEAVDSSRTTGAVSHSLRPALAVSPHSLPYAPTLQSTPPPSPSRRSGPEATLRSAKRAEATAHTFRRGLRGRTWVALGGLLLLVVGGAVALDRALSTAKTPAISSPSAPPSTTIAATTAPPSSASDLGGRVAIATPDAAASSAPPPVAPSAPPKPRGTSRGAALVSPPPPQPQPQPPATASSSAAPHRGVTNSGL